MMEKELPKGWIEVDFEIILERLSNGANYKQEEIPFEGSYPITRIETIADETINLNRVKYVEADENGIEKYGLKKGDILLSHINSDKHLGKTAYFDLDDIVIHGINLLLVRSVEQYNSKLLNYLLKHYRLEGRFIEAAQRSVRANASNL